MLRSRGRNHPFIVVVVAALVFSQLPTLAWAQQQKKLPAGWVQDASRRYAVVVDVKAGTPSFTLKQDQEESTGRSRKSKVFMGVGFGLAGAGAILLAAGPSAEEHTEAGLHLDWRWTGAIWLVSGLVLGIIGLVMK